MVENGKETWEHVHKSREPHYKSLVNPNKWWEMAMQPNHFGSVKTSNSWNNSWGYNGISDDIMGIKLEIKGYNIIYDESNKTGNKRILTNIIYIYICKWLIQQRDLPGMGYEKLTIMIFKRQSILTENMFLLGFSYKLIVLCGNKGNM